jgi:hypothetical protein
MGQIALSMRMGAAVHPKILAERPEIVYDRLLPQND